MSEPVSAPAFSALLLTISLRGRPAAAKRACRVPSLASTRLPLLPRIDSTFLLIIIIVILVVLSCSIMRHTALSQPPDLSCSALEVRVRVDRRMDRLEIARVGGRVAHATLGQPPSAAVIWRQPLFARLIFTQRVRVLPPTRSARVILQRPPGGSMILRKPFLTPRS